MKRILAVIAFVFLAWVGGVGAADTDGPAPDSQNDHGAIRISDGLLVFWNDSSAHFTLELKGENYRVADIEGLGFSIDGFFIQLITVDPALFSPPDATAQDILARHMAFEADHWAKSIGAPMPAAVKSTDSPLPPGMQLWEIRWSPEGREKANSEMVKHLFLTAVIGDRLFSGSHPLQEGEDETAAYAYLERVARSVRQQPSRIDPRELQERIRSKTPSRNQ